MRGCVYVKDHAVVDGLILYQGAGERANEEQLERAYQGQGHALFWNRLYIHFGNRDRRHEVTKF